MNEVAVKVFFTVFALMVLAPLVVGQIINRKNDGWDD